MSAWSHVRKPIALARAFVGLYWAAPLSALLACVNLTPPFPVTSADAGADAAQTGSVDGDDLRDVAVEPQLRDSRAVDDVFDSLGDLMRSDGTVDLPTMPLPLLALGLACEQSSQCASTFCIDGVCCNSACDGLCVACGGSDAPGSCRAAAAGTDPRDACPDDGNASCGRTGVCDGKQACQLFPAETLCGPAECRSGHIATAKCDGLGTCATANTTNCYPYICAAASCNRSCTTSSECLGAAECFGNVCGGLSGAYFDTPDLTGKAVTRVDRDINFNWGGGSPMVALAPDSFSIRWTGQLTPRYSELTTFYTKTDDGVRLWVDDKLIIDDWNSHPATDNTGSIALKARKPVSIRLEYFDDELGAQAALWWSSPSFARQIVPVTALTP